MREGGRTDGSKVVVFFFCGGGILAACSFVYKVSRVLMGSGGASQANGHVRVILSSRGPNPAAPSSRGRDPPALHRGGRDPAALSHQARDRAGSRQLLL